MLKLGIIGYGGRASGMAKSLAAQKQLTEGDSVLLEVGQTETSEQDAETAPAVRSGWSRIRSSKAPKRAMSRMSCQFAHRAGSFTHASSRGHL